MALFPVVGVALMHYPVYDKNRRTVVTAITNLDIHDIARAARTYGVIRYYVVTPVSEQQELAQKIVGHWREGWGADYNPRRREALDLVRIVATLDEARADLERVSERAVKLVATGASPRGGSMSCRELAGQMRTGSDAHLFLFGTGWGMTDELFEQADLMLEPIKGATGYNHLSVRSAAAIILDRLMGEH